MTVETPCAMCIYVTWSRRRREQIRSTGVTNGPSPHLGPGSGSRILYISRDHSALKASKAEPKGSR